MNQLVAEYLVNPYLCLSATDRLILLTLAEHLTGLRIEDLAHVTGAKFRWLAKRVGRLTEIGLVRRVEPGKYALGDTVDTRP